MDPLARLKQKQQKELQHLLEYERKLRDKEIQNTRLLLKKKEKLHDISQKQLKQKEDLMQKAEQRKSEFVKNLSQAKLLEEEQKKHHQSHIEKTYETIQKFEKEYKKEQLEFLNKKMSEHNQQIEAVLKTKEKIEKIKLKELSQSLDEKFKQSEDLKQNLNKQLSDRQKSEQQKLEGYFKQVEQQQQKLEQQRNKKGEMFDEKLDKVEKLKQEKEKELRERQKLRIEADKQKELLTKEFQDDLVVSTQFNLENAKKQFSQTILSLNQSQNTNCQFILYMSIRRPIIQKKELKKEESGLIPKQTLNLKSGLPIRINLQNQNSLSKIPIADQIVQKIQNKNSNRFLSSVAMKQSLTQAKKIKLTLGQVQKNNTLVNKIAFYMVQSYQVWNMMVFDSDQISMATTNDTNEKESFLKQSFYSKVGKSRPSTRENVEPEQWFIRPLNFNSKPENQLVFLKNKNTIEENSLSDDELKQTITIWTLNLTNLEKCINIAKVQTDSLMQEISLWSDHTKLLQDFKQEYQLEHVPKIFKLLQQRSIIDVAFERKKTIITSLLDILLSEFDKKQNYVKELQNNLKPLIQRLITIKLADFNSEFQAELWQVIEKIQIKYEKLFNIRKEFFFLKLFNFTIKLFQINLSWSVDFQNFELNLTLLDQFQLFLTSLQKRHEFGEKKFNQNQAIHSQNEVLFINYNKAINDLSKMLKLNKKLGETQKENLQVQQMFQEYKINTFDQFQDKQQWAQIYKIWKEKYKNSKSKVDEPEQSEGISFGFFQTRMNWSIQ